MLFWKVQRSGPKNEIRGGGFAVVLLKANDLRKAVVF